MGKFRISGVPIAENGKLVGIITNRDLKFEEDFTKKIKDSMTTEDLVTAREGITLDEAKKILAKARKEKHLSRSRILKNKSNTLCLPRTHRGGCSAGQA